MQISLNKGKFSLEKRVQSLLVHQYTNVATFLSKNSPKKRRSGSFDGKHHFCLRIVYSRAQKIANYGMLAVNLKKNCMTGSLRGQDGANPKFPSAT